MLFSPRTAHTFALLRSSTLTATPRPALVHFARAMSQSTASQVSDIVADDRLVLTERRGSVLVLTLNRPKALNALSSPLFEVLNEEFDKAQREEGVRAVVLTGGERVFAGEFNEWAMTRGLRGNENTYLQTRGALNEVRARRTVRAT